MNKTGTTSLQKAFADLGFIVGDQRKAELLLPYYKENNFKAIIEYCKTAQVFQDFPFSFPKTYKHVDKAFHGSKFILTIRDSPEQWYNSITNYHAARFSKEKIATSFDLKNAAYIYKGWMWEAVHLLFNTPEYDPYNKEVLIKKYVDYNNEVIQYFSNRPLDLLVINLAEKGAYKKFCNFFNINSPFDDFPWINRMADIKLSSPIL